MSKEHDDTSWSINTFVKNNDFTNKTVISFCTSLSSPLGESDNFLKEMTTGGTWLEEKRFSSNPLSSDIKNFTYKVKNNN